MKVRTRGGLCDGSPEGLRHIDHAGLDDENESLLVRKYVAR